MRVTSRLNVFQKVGLWDARRYFVCGVVILLAAGLFFQMFGTRPTSLLIVPSGVITQTDGFLFERYDLNIVNGKPADEHYALSAVGLDHLYIFRPFSIVHVARSAQRTVRITLMAPTANLVPGKRYPINISIQALDRNRDRHSIATIFYVPEQSAPLKAG